VIRLANLTPEEFFVLLTRLRHVYASGDAGAYLIPDEALRAFMSHCKHRIGNAYFRTPRTTIKEFVDLLAVLDQNPSASWEQLIGQVDIRVESNPDLAALPEEEEKDRPVAEGRNNIGPDDDKLRSFRL
jgi:hypothetical protein